MALTDLGALATKVLTVMGGYLADLLAEYDVDLPTEQYVGAGEIAWDCEALVVYLGSIQPGEPGQARATSGYPDTMNFSVTLYVELLRSVATLGYEGTGSASVPDTEELNSDGITEMTDAACLVKAAMNMRSNKDIVARSIDLVIGQVVVIGPQGGLVSTRLELIIPLSAANG